MGGTPHAKKKKKKKKTCGNEDQRPGHGLRKLLSDLVEKAGKVAVHCSPQLGEKHSLSLTGAIVFPEGEEFFAVLMLMQVAATWIVFSSRSVTTYAPFQPCLWLSFMSQLSWAASWKSFATPCALRRGSRFLFWALKAVPI